MIGNKRNVKSVVLLHKYMHRDVYDTYQLCIIHDTQLMTKSTISSLALYLLCNF